jgi:hypothetical protein
MYPGRRDAGITIDLSLERDLDVVLTGADPAIRLPEAQLLEATELAGVRPAQLAFGRCEEDIQRYPLRDLLLLAFCHAGDGTPVLVITNPVA